MSRRGDAPLLTGEQVRVSIGHNRGALLIYAVFAVLFVVQTAVSPSFPSTRAITSLLSSALPLVFAAVAQTVVVLVKGIDLSVGPAMSVVMVIAASLMKSSGWTNAGVIVLCLAVGMAIGAFNGFFVVRARLQSIIVTLASSSVLTGVALYVLPQPGGFIPVGLNWLSTGQLGFLPVPGLFLLAVLLLIWLPLRRSRIGQSWYAVGGNEAGAYYSGINVDLARFTAFLAGGFFAALGGLLLAFQTLTGDPMIGAPYTLNSIAATVLGGTSLLGGRGGALGAVGGVLVLTIVVDILFFIGVSAYYQYVFSGTIVILALAAGSFSDFLRTHRILGRRERGA